MLDASSTESARELYDELHNEIVDIELKKFREKRSTEANSYFWVLCGKLAKKLGTTKNEVYLNYIRDVGDNFVDLLVKEDKLKRFVADWEGKGLGWITETYDSPKPVYKIVRAYSGSSSYDTAQMSALINLAVQDCKSYGIQVADDDEIISLLQAWEAT